MDWMRIQILETSNIVYGVAAAKDVWAMRGFAEVSAFRPAETVPMWTHRLQGDHAFGYKGFVVFDDTVVATTHRDKNPNQVMLLGLAVDSGALRWERAVGWRLNHNLGGLFKVDDLLLYQDDSNGLQMVFLDPQSGEVDHTADGIPISNTGLFPKEPQSIVIADTHVYFRAEDDGVYRLFLNDNEPAPARSVAGSPWRIRSNGEDVFILLAEPGQPLVCVDGHSGKEVRRIEMPEGVIVDDIHVLRGGQDVALLLESGMGVAIADMRRRKIAWRTDLEANFAAIDAEFAGDMLIVMEEKGEHRRVRAFDRGTGKDRGLLQPIDGVVTYPLLAVADNILVNSLGRLNVFSRK